MSLLFTSGRRSSLKKLANSLSGKLRSFDEDAIRSNLFGAAGQQLTQIAESSTDSIEHQLRAIHQSVKVFDSILRGMRVVQTNVQHIDGSVGRVLCEANECAHELEQVNSHMSKLEGHFAEIGHLIQSVSRIADQTHLLALNATIEAAHAGSLGRGFAVVAEEVKELANTTKTTNREVRSTLDSIAEAVTALSESVHRSVEKMRLSVNAIQTTRENAAAIGEETMRFSGELERSRETFHHLDASSHQVQNEVQEINAIGKTFNYLLALIPKTTAHGIDLDPLERLAPLVRTSQFNHGERFPAAEAEYVLSPDEVLISATDPRGMITFANNAFYRVAEYDPGELIGRPHNTIRHPDMPRTAFADLWATIKAGQLWQGYVANRSKTGRIYWVLANVFPCFENRQIVGYISLRTRPPREAISRAIQAYRCLP